MWMLHTKADCKANNISKNTTNADIVHPAQHTLQQTQIIIMITIIWGKATLPPHMDNSVVFAKLRQCAPKSNTCFLGPTWDHIPNKISISSAIFLHSSWHRVPILYNGPLFPSKLPLHMGRSGPHLIHGSLGPSESQLKLYLDQFSCFCRAHDSDRQTDHTSPSHLCSTVTQPSNNSKSTCTTQWGLMMYRHRRLYQQTSWEWTGVYLSVVCM